MLTNVPQKVQYRRKCHLSFGILLLVALNSVFAGSMPDTGQTSCYNGSGITDCLADTGFPRQDGSITLESGYTKLDSAGNDLDSSATEWSCVRDSTTGLVWEVKTADAGLRGMTHRYSWYSNVMSLNGGETGDAINFETCGNTLDGDVCVTQNYSAVINATGLCGANDWRLPTQMELLTLVHAGRLNPAIDTDFFPNTASVPYWSSSTYAMTPVFAWGVHFGYGAAHAEPKPVANAVRLVRGAWSR